MGQLICIRFAFYDDVISRIASFYRFYLSEVLVHDSFCGLKRDRSIERKINSSTCYCEFFFAILFVYLVTFLLNYLFIYLIN